MKRTGPEVEAAFRLERRRDLVADIKHGWWMAAILLGLLSVAAIRNSMPRRSLGVEEGMVLAIGLRETDTGSFPCAVIEMSDGSNVRVSVPRNVAVREGVSVRIEVYERTWPWERRTYRYDSLVPYEH